MSETKNKSKDEGNGNGNGNGRSGSKSTSKSNPGKHGFPVLAYLTSHPLTLSCTLRIQHHEPRKQATLMLRTCVALCGAHCGDDEQGGDEEQAFVVQYDADNLVYDARLAAPTVDMPPTRLSSIVRAGTDDSDDTQMQTLTLHLARHGPLWCPDRDVLLPKPEPAHVELFNELTQLAKAKTVHLVFDRSWLSLAQQVPLQRIIKGKEALTGFPVAEYYCRAYRRADWTVFAPAPAAGPSNKRARRGETPQQQSTCPSQADTRPVSSPPTTPPPYKRQLVDPALAGSPTEVATSPPSPRSELSTSETDFQTRAITAVVQRLLPDILKQLLPEVLPEVLSGVLPKTLSGLLPSLFALPPSFTSHASDTSSSSSSSEKRRASPASHTPQTSQTYPQALASIPPHRTLTPLANTLLPHLVAHLTPQLSKLHNASTKKWIDRAALEFQEDAEQHRLELQELVEEGVGELVTQSGYALDEVRAQLHDVAVQAADIVGDDVRDEVEKYGQEAAKKVRWEIDVIRKAAEERTKIQRAERRTGKGKGGYRGVGCRRGGAD